MYHKGKSSKLLIETFFVWLYLESISRELRVQRAKDYSKRKKLKCMFLGLWNVNERSNGGVLPPPSLVTILSVLRGFFFGCYEFIRIRSKQHIYDFNRRVFSFFYGTRVQNLRLMP